MISVCTTVKALESVKANKATGPQQTFLSNLFICGIKRQINLILMSEL